VKSEVIEQVADSAAVNLIDLTNCCCRKPTQVATALAVPLAVTHYRSRLMVQLADTRGHCRDPRRQPSVLALRQLVLRLLQVPPEYRGSQNCLLHNLAKNLLMLTYVSRDSKKN